MPNINQPNFQPTLRDKLQAFKAGLTNSFQNPQEFLSILTSLGWELPVANTPFTPEILQQVGLVTQEIDDLLELFSNHDEVVTPDTVLSKITGIQEALKPLFRLILDYTGLPVPVQDRLETVEQRFAAELWNYLLLEFLNNEFHLYYLLGESLKFVQEQTFPATFLDPDDLNYLIRREINKKQLLIVEELQALPDPYRSLVREGAALANTGINFIIDLLDQKYSELMEAWNQLPVGHRLFGTIVHFDESRVRLLGGSKLLLPSEDAGEIVFEQAANTYPKLKISSMGWELIRNQGLRDEDGTLPIIHEDWGSLTFLPFHRGSEEMDAPGCYLYEKEEKFMVSITGGFEVTLDASLISKRDGDHVQVTSKGTFHLEDGKPSQLTLDETIVSGEFHVEGSGGVKIKNAELAIEEATLPTDTDDHLLPFIVRVSGQLVFPKRGSKLDVLCRFGKDLFEFKSEGKLHLGDGIWLFPISEQTPILSLVSKSEEAFDFSVNGIFKVPYINDSTKDITVRGQLKLKKAVPTVGSENPTAASEANDEEEEKTWIIEIFHAETFGENLDSVFPGNIKLNNLGVAITYEDNKFNARLKGAVELINDQHIRFESDLQFPDQEDPTRIEWKATLDVEKLNFFNRLWIESGKLSVEIATKPERGSLQIIEANAGILPKLQDANVTKLEDFSVIVKDVSLAIRHEPTQEEVELTAGVLQFPNNFKASDSEDLEVAIGSTPLTFTVQNGNLVYSGSLSIVNFTLEFPSEQVSDTALTFTVNAADFVFNGTEATASFQKASGNLKIPIAGRPNIELGFAELRWDFRSVPEAILYLRQNIDFDLGGDFRISLLGSTSSSGNRTSLTLGRNQQNQPSFRLQGAMNFHIPSSMLCEENGDSLFLGATGVVSWDLITPPAVSLEELRIGGTFRLGGASGVRIVNGEISASGIPNMLAHSRQKPFKLDLGGKLFLGDGGPGLGLKDASFVFVGERIPIFDIQGFSLYPGEELLSVVEQLPLKVEAAGIEFEEDLPLPRKIAPTNIRVNLTAGLEIPLPLGGTLGGKVEGISIRFNQEGIPVKRDGTPGIEIEGIQFGIDNFIAGPASLTGMVYLGGLDKPEDLFFAGKVGAKISDAGATALLAIGTRGPRGMCLEANAGPAGIVLPFGFLITGAQGGIIFPNLDGKVSNADPCDIRTYVRLNESGIPERTTQNPIPRPEVPDDETVILEESVSDPLAFDCPSGPCPPPAISILSQPHPDRRRYPDRVILKFTSIDERTLNSFGITPQFFNQLGLTTPPEIAEAAVGNLFDLIEQGFPDVNSLPLDTEKKALVSDKINQMKADTRALLTNTFAEAITIALGGNQSVYEAVKELAYAGIPSPETTLKLTGTFSHAAVSTFLSITGGFSISSVMLPLPVPLISSVGILGAVNVLGIPMGTARVFLNTTDSQGNPLLIPTMCGELAASIGPVSFGQLKFFFKADGLADGLMNAVSVFAEKLTGPIIREIFGVLDEQLLSNFDENNLLAFFEHLSPGQLANFVGALMSLPPEKISPDIRECIRLLVINSWNSFNPTFTMCGQAQPKIFGFPLGGELTSTQVNITKTSFAAQLGISPSFILRQMYGGIFPAYDRASLGMGFGLPDPVALLDKMLFTDRNSMAQLDAYLKDGVSHVLENATMTLQYELNPFGLKFADAQARILMPDLVNHPVYIGNRWMRPESRSDKKYLSRKDLLIKMQESNVLASILWKGSKEDMEKLSAGGTHELSLKAYFPHGGFLGAASISLPVVLLEGIPMALFSKVFDPGTDLLERFSAVTTVFEEYLLKMDDVGKMAFYIPLPNPPSLTIAGASPDPLSIVRKMQDGRINLNTVAIGEILSVEEAFFEGTIDNARILGIPIFEASVTAYGPDRNAGKAGIFEIIAKVPKNSWMSSFVDSAEFRFVLSQTPTRPIDEYFKEILDLIEYHHKQPRIGLGSPQIILYTGEDFQGQERKLRLGDYRTQQLGIGDNALKSIQIPENSGLKVILYEDDNFSGRSIILTGSMTGLGNFKDLVSSIRVVRSNPLENLQELFVQGLPKLSMMAEINRLRIPAPLDQIFKVRANASLKVQAYSPFYDPGAVGADMESQLKRNGGIYFEFKGDFDAGGIFKVTNAKFEIAVLPFSDSALLPKMVSRLSVNHLDMPLGLPKLEKVSVSINTLPEKNENFVEAQGIISFIPLGLLRLVPLAGNSIAGKLLISDFNPKGRFFLSLSSIKVADQGFMRSDFEMFGQTPKMPFTISSHAVWSAQASGSRVKLFVGNAEIIRIQSNVSFSAACTGVGFDQVRLRVHLPGSVTIQSFPGNDALKRQLTLGNQGQTVLEIANDGTFSVSAVSPAFVFGILIISGLNRSNLSLTLSNSGFTLNSGGELHLQELTTTPYRVTSLQINTNATFNLSVEGGVIGVAGFFNISGGSLAASRNAQGTISMAVQSPTFRIFPGTTFENNYQVGSLQIQSNGNFDFNLTRQSFLIRNLISGTVSLRVSKTRSNYRLELADASLRLTPLGFDVNGSVNITKDEVKAELESKTFSVSGLIEITPSNWQLEWTKGQSFTFEGLSPNVKILGRDINPSTRLIFSASSNGSFEVSFGTSQSMTVIPSLVLLAANSQLSLSKNTGGVITLDASGTVSALKNPVTGAWILNHAGAIRLSSGDFKHEIVALRSRTFVDVRLARIFTNNNSRCFLERRRNIFSVQMENIRVWIMGREAALNGSCTSTGAASLSWASDAELTLGPFRLPNRRPSVSMNFLNPSFRVTIPAGKLMGPRVTGFPANGIDIPQISIIGRTGFDLPLTRDFTFNGMSMRSSGTGNSVRLRDSGILAIRNRLSLFGSTANMSLDIQASGVASGHILGTFTIGGFGPFPRFTLSSIRMVYSSSRPNYQFQYTGNHFVHIPILGRRGVRVILRFGSAGPAVPQIDFI